jgi:hypothetical protein
MNRSVILFQLEFVFRRKEPLPAAILAGQCRGQSSDPRTDYLASGTVRVHALAKSVSPAPPNGRRHK